MPTDNGFESILFSISKDMAMVDEILNLSINHSEVSLIKDAATHIIASGGKRFRPALAILSSKICGYGGENASHLGAAIELIHTASLIHDDVLDSADLRRGVQTANARWGNHLSILVGDYCLSMASKILSTHTNQEILSKISDAARETTEGEVLEVVHGNNFSMDLPTYTDIIRKKTACLMATSCETGGMLAEAPPRMSSALREFGMNLGIAFQVVDDVLDFTTESKLSGKRKGTDLKEGKLTLPMIYALKHSEPEETRTIRESLMASTYSEDLFKKVADILDKYGCITEARKTAAEFLARATNSLSPFKESLEKETLIKLANLVTNRRS